MLLMKGGELLIPKLTQRHLPHAYFLWSFRIFPPALADWGLHGAAQLRFAALVMVMIPMCRLTSEFSLVSFSLRS